MICENCGKEHNGNYGSGRFCSATCRTIFTNKQRGKRSEETKRKISEALKSKVKSNRTIKSKKIIVKKSTLYKKCPICGREYEYIKGANSSCSNNFCKEHNIQHFRNLVKYFTFDKSKLGTIEVEQEFNRVREMLYDLYWNQHKSSTELANMFNYKSCATNITQKFFRTYLNIPIKSLSESVKENYFENRLNVQSGNQYVQQWYTTWNNKEVYLRSSYEINFAKQLDKQKIDYEVEALRIKYWDSQRQEYRCAIPDFYIPNENMIVEIKSSWTLDKQNMMDKKKAYVENGYKFKCICEFEEIEI